MTKFLTSRMGKKLKIALITHNFPNSEKERVNAGIFSFDLAKALSKKAEVVVFSPGTSKGKRRIGGIMAYFFEFSAKLGSLKIYNPLHFIKFISFFISGEKALNQFIRENPDIDFVISMWAFPGGDFANYFNRKFKIPYAIYCLGSDIYIYAQKPILKNMIKKYLMSAKFILADGIDLADKTEQLSDRRVQFLPSTTNFPVGDPIKSKTDKIVFTFLGRLEKVKGVDTLIEALNSIKDNKLHFQVNIIGDGSLRNWIKQNTKNKWIKMWGNLDDVAKISLIFRNSDWLVIPSRSDSIPLVFSEGVKTSLPVIVSDLPDLKYLVKKYNIGYLFKSGDSSDLAKVLKKAFTSKKDHSNFRTNLKEAAKIFDIDKSADILIDLINRNLSKDRKNL